LTELGQVRQLRGQIDEARAFARESVELFRTGDDRMGLALALQNLAALVLHGTAPDYAAARTMYVEELSLFADLGDAWGRGLPLLGLGRVAIGERQYRCAAGLLEEARSVFEALGDRRLLGFVLNRLGELARIQADYARAATIYRHSLLVWRDLGQQLGLAAALEGLAVAAAAWGDAAQAAGLFGAAAGLRAESGSPSGWQTDDPVGRERALAGTRERLGAERFEMTWAEGRARPSAQVEQALVAAWSGPSGGGPSATLVAQRGGLTSREREVAALVARGLSTRDIASQLVVSERTVDNHVQHIRDKLHLRSRAQIATWSVAHDLV
jgi:DNA-binding CsgD family transcriptional regulator